MRSLRIFRDSVRSIISLRRVSRAGEEYFETRDETAASSGGTGTEVLPDWTCSEYLLHVYLVPCLAALEMWDSENVDVWSKQLALREVIDR